MMSGAEEDNTPALMDLVMWMGARLCYSQALYQDPNYCWDALADPNYCLASIQTGGVGKQFHYELGIPLSPPSSRSSVDGGSSSFTIHPSAKLTQMS